MANPNFTGWPGARIEGYLAARAGDALFPDAASEFMDGWCGFHGCANPYSPQSVTPATTSDETNVPTVCAETGVTRTVGK